MLRPTTALFLMFLATCPPTAQAQAFDWAFGFGGTGQDVFHDVVIGPLGETVLVGTFAGTATFASGFGLLSQGGTDLVLRCFEPSADPDLPGGVLVGLGGPGDDGGLAVDTDGLGGIWVAGYFSDAVDTGSGIPLLSAGGTDALFIRFSPVGDVMWAVAGADTGSIRGTDIAVDPATGECFGTGYFPGQGEFGGVLVDAAGGTDAVVLKIDPLGNMLWAAVAGGPGNDEALAVAIDGSGGAYVTGTFEQTATFGDQVLTVDNPSGFVARLDPLGNFLWAAAISAGDPAGAAGRDLVVLPGGICFVCGDYTGPADIKGEVLADLGDRAVFAALFSGAGDLAWGTGIGDPGGVNPVQLGRPRGTGQTTGHIITLSVDNAGPEIVALDDAGLILDRDPLVLDGAVRGLAFAPAGHLVLCGSFSGEADFGGIPVANQGGEDAFLARRANPAAGVAPDLPTPRASLDQNAPNPFNPATTIRYALAASAAVRLEVFDTAGRGVRTLVTGHQAAGDYRVVWNGRDDQGLRVASGVYLVRLQAAGITRIRQAVLVK